MLTPDPIEEAARRAGVDPAYVSNLIVLGIVRPRDDGGLTDADLRRVRLIRMLDDAGIDPQGISAAVRSGVVSLDFVESATYERFASFTDESFAQVSERTGVPIELLVAMREATGGAVPEPTDRVRADELSVVEMLRFQLELGFRPLVAERALRVTGESLRRIAETEADWWNTEIVQPRLASGAGWMDIAVLAERISRDLSDRTDAAILAIHHAHQTQSWMRNILEGVETQLASIGLAERPDRQPPAVCFLDITGYTRLTEEHGDETAAHVAERLARMVQRTSMQHGGRPVKWLGDGVMLYFPEPARAVPAALEMVDGVREAGLPPAHVGLHAGPVLFQEGDYFGRTVNTAARIAEYARPGEVLVTQEVVDLARGASVTFAEVGPVELKGVGGSIRLFSARGPG